MTTDIQERLRDDLANLTSTRLDLGIDPDDLISAGHRTRRARTVRRAAGGGSLALAAVLLAVAIGPRPGMLSAPVIPAAPALSPGMLTDAAYFSVDGMGLGEDTDRLELDVEASGTGWVVTGIGTRSDGLLTEKWTFDQDAAPSAVQLAPKVILELLPSRVDWSQVVMKDKKKRVSGSDYMHVGALDLTASLVWFGESTRLQDIAGFIWEGPDGVVRDSLGSTIKTVDVALPSRTFQVFWDQALDVLSYQSLGGQVFVSGAVPSPGSFPRFLGQLDGPPGSARGTEVYGDVLPKGAHDLNIELASAQGEWAQAELGGRTVYIVTFPSASQKPIRSISYRGADGEPVSLRMP